MELAGVNTRLDHFLDVTKMVSGVYVPQEGRKLMDELKALVLGLKQEIGTLRLVVEDLECRIEILEGGED